MTVTDKTWDDLYAAEYDLRFALAHQQTAPTLGQASYAAEEIETFRQRVTEARAAVTTEATSGTRERLAAAWSAYLDLALDDRLDDGTRVLSLALARRPDLAERLTAALTTTGARA